MEISPVCEVLGFYLNEMHYGLLNFQAHAPGTFL